MRGKARHTRIVLWSAGALIGVAVLGALVIVLVAAVDANWLKGPLERRVQASTGRGLVIDGDLDFRPGLFAVGLRAERVRFANASWSERPQMFTADAVDLSLSPWSLLRGRLVFPTMSLERPQVVLERNRDRIGNWRFGRNPRERHGRAPAIGVLTVSDGHVEYLEPTLNTALRVDVHSVGGKAVGPRPGLVATGDGRYRDAEFKLQGIVDSPAELLRQRNPFHVDVRARAGGTEARVRGNLNSPLQLEDIVLRVEVAGPDMDQLFPLLGIPAPETPPYAIDGVLTRQGKVIRYQAFVGVVGDSDVSGDLVLRLDGEKPHLTGNVFSKRLDFDDLAGLVGAPPDTKPGETASEQQREEARIAHARTRVLPDKPYNLAKLRAMDAEVELRADRINSPKLPLDSMAAHLRLKDGLLVLDPLEVGVAGGTLQGTLALDARHDRITTKTRLDARGVQLAQLFPKLKQGGTGKIAGEVSLEGNGNSVAQMLATSDGSVGLVMGRGRVSNLLLELAGLDIAESLRFLVGEDKTVPLRCAYADFTVKDGTMKAQALAFDTTDTELLGEGKVNLANEELDLKLRPEPKDKSPLSLRVPLHIGGTLKDPSFRPEGKRLVLKTAAAAALFAVTPPAALLALIETGPGENVDCGRARAEAKAMNEQGKPAKRKPTPDS